MMYGRIPVRFEGEPRLSFGVRLDSETGNRTGVGERCSEACPKAFRRLVKAKKYSEAIKFSTKVLQVQKVLGKTQAKVRTVIGLVILYLSRNDVVAARKCLAKEIEENSQFPQQLRSRQLTSMRSDTLKIPQCQAWFKVSALLF